jgi:uncharacterized ferritin-like protein (DUF455 family)
MKGIIFGFFVLVATVVASFNVEDIPLEMRERLDRYILLRRAFFEKWMSMSLEERLKFARVFNERLQEFPQIDLKRIHDLVEKKLSEDQQHKLRKYLEMRFLSVSQNDLTRTSEESKEETTNVSDLEMIDLILKDIPRAVRDRIHISLNRNFEEATAYNAEVSGKKVN